MQERSTATLWLALEFVTLLILGWGACYATVLAGHH